MSAETRSYKSPGQKDSATATERESKPGKPTRDPGQDNDDCTPSYQAERLKDTEWHRERDESIPSAGWRSVYAAMGVRQR